MASKIYTVDLAGTHVRFKFNFDETKKYFTRFTIDETEGEEYDVMLDEDTFNRHKEFLNATKMTPFLEFSMLLSPTCTFLLKHNRCLYHGVAFLWREKAWLLTAPSGVGKSTQFKLWNKLHGDEIEIINGDKPILEYSETDDCIIVHPSPWNGKENFRGTKSAPLGGIVYLAQKDENTIETIGQRTSVVPIFVQFLCYNDTEDDIRGTARMEDHILKSVPVWVLQNLGDDDSAELTYKTLLEYEQRREK